MSHNPALSSFCNWLQAQCLAVSLFEKSAKEALERKDTATYRHIMQEKAQLLAELSVHAVPFLSSLPPALKERIAKELASFSASAQQALNLDSVFYMSALLYPEDYLPGTPNNLEVFLESFTQREKT